MKQAFFILLIAVLTGCSTKKSVVPSYKDKPRVKINQQIPNSTAPAPVNKNAQGTE